MGVKFNVSNAESGFTPIPAGTYKAKVDKAEDRSSNGSGKNDLQVDFKVMEGKSKGKNVRGWISFNEAADWKLREYCEAIGVPLKGDSEKLAKQSVGKVCTLVVIRDSFNEQPNNRITKYLALDDSDEDDADEAEDDAEDEEDEEPEDDADNDEDADSEDEDDEEEDADEEDDEEDDDEEDEPPYEEWAVSDLRTEAERRGIKIIGKSGKNLSSAALIKKLEADDNSDAPF